VKNTDNLFKAIERFTEIPAAEKEQMKALLSKSYGEKAFKENMKLSSVVFPSEAIAIGDQWSVKNIFTSGNLIEIETTYELKEAAEEYYLITGISKITSLNKDTYIEQNGIEMRSDLIGTMKTMLKINRKTGWIINGETEQHIKGNNYIKDSAAIPGGITIAVESTNKIISLGN